MPTETYTFTAVVNQQDEEYYAFCPEECTDATGGSPEEALANLQQATLFQLEEEKAISGYSHPTLTSAEFTVKMADGPSRTYTYDVVVHQEHGLYVVFCPELGIADQGGTIEEALAMLKEGGELLIEDNPPPGYGKPSLSRFAVETDKVAGIEATPEIEDDDLMPGVLMNILRQARIPLEDFVATLGSSEDKPAD